MHIQTFLPAGSEVRAWVVVSDSLGSVSSSGDPQGSVQVRNSSTAQLTSALQGLGQGRVDGAQADKAVSTLALVTSSVVSSLARGNRSQSMARLAYSLAVSVGNVTRRMGSSSLSVQRAGQMVSLLEALVADPAALTSTEGGTGKGNATALAALDSLHTLLATTATAPQVTYRQDPACLPAWRCSCYLVLRCQLSCHLTEYGGPRVHCA